MPGQYRTTSASSASVWRPAARSTPVSEPARVDVAGGVKLLAGTLSPVAGHPRRVILASAAGPLTESRPGYRAVTQAARGLTSGSCRVLSRPSRSTPRTHWRWPGSGRPCSGPTWTRSPLPRRPTSKRRAGVARTSGSPGFPRARRPRTGCTSTCAHRARSPRRWRGWRPWAPGSWSATGTMWSCRTRKATSSVSNRARPSRSARGPQHEHAPAEIAAPVGQV